MPYVSFSTIAINDAALLDGMLGIVEKVSGARESTFHWRLLNDGPEDSCATTEARANQRLAPIVSQGMALLQYAKVQFSGTVPDYVAITYSRSPNGDTIARLDLPEPWSRNQAARDAISLAFTMAFHQYARSNLLAAVEPRIAEFYARREETLVRLEELHGRILREADEERRKRHASLEAEREKLQAETQHEREQLEREFTGKNAQLSVRSEALDEREKTLDDRSNTHARRQLQQELKAILKDRSSAFSLTKTTVAKRRPAHVAFWGLMLVLAGSLGWNAYQAGLTADAYALLRLSISLAAFAGSVIYYIRLAGSLGASTRGRGVPPQATRS